MTKRPSGSGTRRPHSHLFLAVIIGLACGWGCASSGDASRDDGSPGDDSTSTPDGSGGGGSTDTGAGSGGTGDGGSGDSSGSSVCTPTNACDSYACGTDSCGKSCGTCTVGQVCTGAAKSPGMCVAMPESQGSDPTKLPTPTGTCPELKNGTLTFAGQSVEVTVGPKGMPGPLLLYWHATGTTAAEVGTGFSGFISDVKKNGGVVASFASTTSQGTNTGNGVWFTGDFATADEVVACAVAQGFVDPRRIHTSGYSAGGLQCGAMVYQRSGYLASALCLSGGIIKMLDFLGTIYKPQDPGHIPPVIAAHGKAGSDVIVIDFSACSADLCADITKRGGFAVNCDDGGDHIMGMFGRMMTMGNVASTFFKDHPFGVNPYPYASGLPSVFPATCVITK